MSATAALGSRAIIGEFYMRLEQARPPAWVDSISFRVDSNQPSEEYKWLGMTPALREWVGGRQAKGFRENGLTVANKTFEATLEVNIDDLRRDKTGQILVRVGELAERAAAHPASLLSALIDAGETTPCYDGQYFFDTDHSEGASGVQSNDIVVDISDEGTGGSPTAPTPETVQRAIFRCIEKIMSFKDDQGEPMNETASQFLVMVPVPFMTAAMAAVAQPLLGGGNSNLILNQDNFRIGVAVNPRLSWTTKLAVFRTDGRVKPFINQVEQDVMIDAIAEGSEEEFKNRRHLYGVTRIGNAAYGYWQHACLATLQA